MNNTLAKPVRSIPLMLVLLVMVAAVFSNVLQYCIPQAIYQWTNYTSVRSYTIVLLVSQALYFPFSTTIVFWLASRSGRTSSATWLVPIAMLITISAFPVVSLFASMLLSGNNFIGPYGLVQLLMVLQSVLRPSLTSFVFMAFAFRVATLHLRPVEASASVHRLSVTTLILLTTSVAVMLSVDASANQWIRQEGGQFIWPNQSLRYLEFLISVFHEFYSALLWFSLAWSFVARNPRRWLGILGLSTHIISGGLYYLVFLPMYVDQYFVNSSTPSQYGTSYFVGSFAISFFHDAIVLLCFGMIHSAGYRWDIYRILATEQVELKQNLDAIPPVIATRIDAVFGANT